MALSLDLFMENMQTEYKIRYTVYQDERIRSELKKTHPDKYEKLFHYILERHSTAFGKLPDWAIINKDLQHLEETKAFQECYSLKQIDYGEPVTPREDILKGLGDMKKKMGNHGLVKIIEKGINNV